VQFQQIAIPTPGKVFGNSEGARGRGLPKEKTVSKKSIKLKWNFQTSGREGSDQKTSHREDRKGHNYSGMTQCEVRCFI